MVVAISMFLSILTAGSHVFLGILLAAALFFREKLRSLPLYQWFVTHTTAFAFSVALTATLGSLFYSEIAGYVPCVLCWYQRILMYPQTLILGTALIKKDSRVFLYSLPLSYAGGAIALYHYYLQLGGNPLIPCSTVGYSVSCAQRFVMEFGYITIPLMSLTAFILLIVLMRLQKARV